MPMRSQAQRRFLWAEHPDIARRYEDHTPKGAKLPDRVKKKADGDVPTPLMAAVMPGMNQAAPQQPAAQQPAPQQPAPAQGWDQSISPVLGPNGMPPDPTQLGQPAAQQPAAPPPVPQQPRQPAAMPMDPVAGQSAGMMDLPDVDASATAPTPSTTESGSVMGDVAGLDAYKQAFEAGLMAPATPGKLPIAPKPVNKPITPIGPRAAAPGIAHIQPISASRGGLLSKKLAPGMGIHKLSHRKAALGGYGGPDQLLDDRYAGNDLFYPDIFPQQSPSPVAPAAVAGPATPPARPQLRPAPLATNSATSLPPRAAPPAVLPGSALRPLSPLTSQPAAAPVPRVASRPLSKASALGQTIPMTRYGQQRSGSTPTSYMGTGQALSQRIQGNANYGGRSASEFHQPTSIGTFDAPPQRSAAPAGDPRTQAMSRAYQAQKTRENDAWLAEQKTKNPAMHEILMAGRQTQAAPTRQAPAGSARSARPAMTELSRSDGSTARVPTPRKLPDVPLNGSPAQIYNAQLDRRVALNQEFRDARAHIAATPQRPIMDTLMAHDTAGAPRPQVAPPRFLSLAKSPASQGSSSPFGGAAGLPPTPAAKPDNQLSSSPRPEPAMPNGSAAFTQTLMPPGPNAFAQSAAPASPMPNGNLAFAQPPMPSGPDAFARTPDSAMPNGNLAFTQPPPPPANNNTISFNFRPGPPTSPNPFTNPNQPAGVTGQPLGQPKPAPMFSPNNVIHLPGNNPQATGISPTGAIPSAPTGSTPMFNNPAPASPGFKPPLFGPPGVPKVASLRYPGFTGNGAADHALAGLVAAGVPLAFLAGGVGAMGVGAARAPKGRRFEGAYRGGSRFGHTMGGALGGAMLGGAAGSEVGGTAGTLGGAALGALGGGYTGKKLWEWTMPEPTWDRHRHHQTR